MITGNMDSQTTFPREIDLNTPDIMHTGLLLSAIHFAAQRHRDQRRKNPGRTPYINHPIDVANILFFEGGVRDPVVLIAAVLHDTIEDTQTTLMEIENLFGEEVRKVVAEVTDEKNIPHHQRKSGQVEKAPYLSPRAKLVRLADKISNLRDVLADPPLEWTPARQHAYFQWAAKVIAGVRGIHPELEALFDDVQDKFHGQHSANTAADM